MKIVSKQDAIDELKRGKIGIFPTDTTFGVGCRIDDEGALKRLFKIRRRPQEKAVLALIDSIVMAEKYLEPFPDEIRNLMNMYWPGGLTIVLSCKEEKVPPLVRGGGKTIGMRLPDHELMQSIIQEVGVPIVAPSANFAGGRTPFTLAEIDFEFIKLVDFVLEGECTLKKPSTVVDCSQKPWRIIREGAVRITL